MLKTLSRFSALWDNPPKYAPQHLIDRLTLTVRKSTKTRKVWGTKFTSASLKSILMVFGALLLLAQWHIFNMHSSSSKKEVVIRKGMKEIPRLGEVPTRPYMPTDYILWSKDDTYFETCRKRYIGNATWGQPLAKFVDKAQVKSIVEAMNIKGLKIPKTYALYNKANISELTVEKMRQIPQPYIIKPTHTSGMVSRVKNDVWTCFKECNEEVPIGQKAIDIILSKSMSRLENDFSAKHNEPQYKDIPHQIIFEEDVFVGDVKSDVTFWYTSNGHPIFTSVQCSPTGNDELGTRKERAFVNMNFERLNMRLLRPSCPGVLVRPANWEKQVEVATVLAARTSGILRIDLYGGENKIFFSEFTYTTSFCRSDVGFRPRVADGLLHAVQYGAIDPAIATPELVESIVHDTSWVFVSLLNGRTVDLLSSGAFPSPVDLCEYANDDHIKLQDNNWQSDDKVNYCLAATKEVATAQLRCVVGSNKIGEGESLNVLSDDKTPTFAVIMTHVDWGRATILFLAVTVMTWMNIGLTRQKNQYVNSILYLVGTLIYLRLFVPRVKSTFSGYSILDTAKQSFDAFVYVHPMASPQIALSHFATYWILVASWLSKSPRNLLMWQFLYETVTAIVNEFCHLIEDQDIIHCARVAFKESVRPSAFDDMIRVYVLPPFFVYGYLLPQFIIYWTKGPILWFGTAIALHAMYKLKVAKRA